MKVIDLLNMIANGEEVPKKIKVYEYEWLYEPLKISHIPYYSILDGYNIVDYFKLRSLNEEVEIIEEEKIISIIQDCGVKMKEFCETTRRIWKLIEEVEEYPIEKEEEKEIEHLYFSEIHSILSTDVGIIKHSTHKCMYEIQAKINELIDAVNEMRKEK